MGGVVQNSYSERMLEKFVIQVTMISVFELVSFNEKHHKMSLVSHLVTSVVFNKFLSNKMCCYKCVRDCITLLVFLVFLELC